MISKIDVNSEMFLNELEVTKNFTKKVVEQFSFSFNPEADVNESVEQGLTRNKLIYGKRYCPCFAVVGETPAQRKEADNRICPCTPALKQEIPNDGKCTCGIFCTNEYAKEQALLNEIEEATHSHSRGLNTNECEVLLNKDNIDSSELEALLDARSNKDINFNLVDVREWMEWVGKRIEGCDYLVPTTSFYNAIEELNSKKDIPCVVYCHIGSRSAYCQNMMRDMGYKSVTNLAHGIVGFQGKTLFGE